MSAVLPPASGPNAQRGQFVYRFDIPLLEMASEPIKGFDTYWHGKRKGGLLPARADIDPAEIKPLLPD
ncbi:MAG TPA: PAS domain-containing protein, partial [Dongiaceae bacterium]